ncbi:MAG: HD domain-containing protein [Candidatus Aenigmarchaeota archaeon]|nr:HD domain-containing protein [Candidatus Aenigmarchaeota archaeon]
MSETEQLAKLIFETGQLKRLKRSGWSFAGVQSPESVADHSWRAALIGLFIAKMEKADENKVVKMCILHDLAETRTGDVNRVNDRYIEDKGEKKAFEDILSGVFKNDLLAIVEEYDERETKESIIAKDADLLELFVQAKEYKETGYSSVADWMKNAKAALKTKSAKELADKLESMDPTSWWHGLKKIPND